MAIETNIRIVEPGPGLDVQIRHANIRSSDITADLLEKACGKLRYRRQLAAVVVRGEVPGIVVATTQTIPSVRLEDEEWQLDLDDAGEEPRTLTLSDAQGQSLIPKLVERALQIELARRTNLWTLATTRIWYENAPLRTQDGIAAYRRYEVAAMNVDDAGVGVACDIGTAFFSEHPVSYYFEPTLPRAEAERRSQEFARLTDRQSGQKGTLLYDIGKSRVQCYFEQAPSGVTCSTTGTFRVKGESFSSLAEYYRRTHPHLGNMDNDIAVRVSFGGLGRPKWVAGSRLRARIANSSLPRSLNEVDKIAPRDRRRLIANFWERLGATPFGQVARGIRPDFWRPTRERVFVFAPSQLQYARANLAQPASASPDAVKTHYRNRLRFLNDHGCYEVPPVVDRTVFVAYPAQIDELTAQRFIADVVADVNKLTGGQFTAEAVSYRQITDGIEQLRRRARSGTALFVLDRNPVSYHEVAFQLQGWRIKRVTQRTLTDHHRALTRPGEAGYRARSRWEQYVRMSVLDLIQRMDVIPWRIDTAGDYESQLAIDVGHDRRHFALSLVIARDSKLTPSFRIVTKVQVKSDPKHEAINARFLSDHIVSIFESALGRNHVALRSLLVLRDGRSVGREPEGIETGLAQLRQRGYLSADARVDVVEVHKKSLKFVRIWQVDGNGRESNPIEGTAVQLSSRVMVMSTTGCGTVRQGTSEPLMLVCEGRCQDLRDAAGSVFATAQLNWSSPTTAQSLPLTLKRTDEELRSRADQEIRRIR